VWRRPRSNSTPPVPVGRLIDYLAQAAAPCALFAMGVTLALRPLKRVPVELGFIVPMKLIAHPVLMYLGLSLIGDFEPVWVYTAVLLASLPTATNVFVIAQQYSTWVERASATVLVTTVSSVASVSALLWLITSGTLAARPVPRLRPARQDVYGPFVRHPGVMPSRIARSLSGGIAERAARPPARNACMGRNELSRPD
jgi:hypothetical protein